MTPRRVSIHYRRLPDRVQVFDQIVIEETPEMVVTFLERSVLPRPIVADGRVLLEQNAPVIWFTFPGRWYDIGRFHLADGTYTGVYANILTPVMMSGDRWDTTDLCLDVWAGTDGAVRVMDEEELREAIREEWIDPATARRARQEAESIEALARAGAWPPPEVQRWTLATTHDRLNELRTPAR